MKKPQPSSAVPTSSLAVLLRIVACADAAFAISGVPLMVAQGAYVDFRAAILLLIFQLCYIVPQFLFTERAEKVAARLTAPVALFLTLAVSAAAGAMGVYALMSHSVFLFFSTRFINGVFRHEKLLSRLVAAQLGRPASEPGQWALYGLLIGMVVPGVLYDRSKDAVGVAAVFFFVEVAVAVLAGVLAVLMRGVPAKKLAASDTVLAYHDWLTGVLRLPGAAAVRAATAVLVAGALLASTHQSLYAIVDPSILHSFTLTGAHLAVGLTWSVWGVPWLLRQLHWAPAETRVATAAFALLLAGGVALPVSVKTYAASSFGWAAYLAAAAVFDVGAGLLTAHLSTRLRTAIGPSNADNATRLTIHVLTGAKLMGAVVRLLVAENMPWVTYPLYVIGPPLGVFVMVQVYGGSPRAAIAAATAACALAVTVN